MKKCLLISSALLLSLAASACTHNNGSGNNNGNYNAGESNTQQSVAHYEEWEHKEHKRMCEALFHDINKSGNGQITRGEFDEYMHKWFREADANHNDKLTFKEFEAQLKREKERLQRHTHHYSHNEEGNASGDENGQGDMTGNENSTFNHANNQNGESEENEPSHDHTNESGRE